MSEVEEWRNWKRRHDQQFQRVLDERDEAVQEVQRLRDEAREAQLWLEEANETTRSWAAEAQRLRTVLETAREALLYFSGMGSVAVDSAYTYVCAALEASSGDEETRVRSDLSIAVTNELEALKAKHALAVEALEKIEVLINTHSSYGLGTRIQKILSALEASTGTG